MPSSRRSFSGLSPAHRVAVLAVGFTTVHCETQRDVVAIEPSSDSSGGAPDSPPQGGAGDAAHPSGGTAAGSTRGGNDGLPAGGSEAAGTVGSGANGTGAGVAGDGGTSNKPECFPRVPLTTLAGVVRTTCTAALARDRMSHALCACDDLEVIALMSTDAFDSKLGTSVATSGASVGVNGRYPNNTYAGIHGSLTVAGPSALSLDGLDISGDVRLAGAVTSFGPVRIGRDGWFQQSLSVIPWMTVERDLHMAPGTNVKGLSEVSGSTLEEAFTFDPPCRCGADPEFDLEAAVLDARDHNDNAVIGLAPEQFSEAKEARDIVLPCGRFFLTELRSTRSIRLQVTGPAALFVSGDVLPSGGITIELGSEGELDWFVQGRLDLSSAVRVGDTNRAAALRIYAAGTSEITFSPSRVAANLHAPQADVTLLGIGDLYGSVLARTVRAVGALGIHYDRAVLNVPTTCGEPSVSTCASCGACLGGLTCISGVCATCATDTDCCDPLVCNAGQCEPLLSTELE